MFQATKDTQFPSPEKTPFKKSNANQNGANINQSRRSIKNSKINDRYGNEYIEIKNDNKEKRNREIQSPFAQTPSNGNTRELNGENIYKSEDMLPNLASTDFQKFKNQNEGSEFAMHDIITGPALGYSSDFPSKELRKKYKKNVKKKELKITKLIKKLLREELAAAIDKFVEKFNVKCSNEESIKKSLFELILSKCKGVFTMIFFQNKAKFFKLLRKNMEAEKQLVSLWEELVGMYEYFKTNDVDSEPVLRQFVRRALSFPTLQEEMAFLLRYMFKVIFF